MNEFDYIVVGAGSAGCVVAHRLTQAGAAVLLLEAGGDDTDPLVKIPAVFSGLFQGQNDWNYNSEPEPGLFGRRVFLPRGKLLGGSSSLNAMIYIRGTKADYDGWNERDGIEGWSYDDVLPYFVKSETNADITDEFHGTDGPLHVTTDRWLSPASHMFIDSAINAGMKRNSDFNGREQEGAGYFQGNIKNGARWSSADGYLRPALASEGLTLSTRALVHRILFEDGRAVGVEYEVDGERLSAYVRNEVVLSAGAYNSPQLLMVSGIGPADDLSALGIDVVADMPNVGKHLQDHPLTVMHWETSAAPSDTLEDAANPAYLDEWIAGGTGKLTSFAAEATVYWKSESGLASPDFQFIFVAGYFWEHGMRKPGGGALSIALSYNGPSSTGAVTLRSSDPTVAPRIVSNLLNNTAELDAVLRAMDFADEIVAQEPIASIVGERVNPGRGVTTREQRADWVRAETNHMYHPTSTCRMGTPEDGVVDSRLRVHGIKNLRVIDASVMPRVTSGNTHAPAVMIGERGAEFLLADRVEAATPARRGQSVETA